MWNVLRHGSRTYTNKARVYDRLDYVLNFVGCPRFNMIGTWEDLYDDLGRKRTFTLIINKIIIQVPQTATILIWIC